MKTLLAGLFILGALAFGVASPRVEAATGFTHAGVVGHSGAPVARTVAASTNSAGFGCGAITCAAYEAGVNGYLQDVAHDSGGSNNVYSVATQYSDNTGSIAYSQTFGGTYTDTTAFPANGCTTAASTCLTQAQLVTAIQRDMQAKGWT